MKTRCKNCGIHFAVEPHTHEPHQHFCAKCARQVFESIKISSTIFIAGMDGLEKYLIIGSITALMLDGAGNLLMVYKVTKDKHVPTTLGKANYDEL